MSFAACHRHLLFGCAALSFFIGATGPARAQTEQEPIPVKVGYMPIAECAHLYVGLANGYFQAEGLKVQLIPMKGGAVILPALQHGNLDIGFSNVVSIIGVDAALPTNDPTFVRSLIGATYERKDATNHALLVLKDSRLTVADLARTRTKIGLNTTLNIEELALRRYLMHHGLRPKLLNLISIPFPEMLSALDHKSIDVAAVVEPFIQPALRTGKYRLLSNQYQEGAPETLVATYATTSGWWSTHPKVAQHFAAAFRTADRFIREHPDLTRKAIGQYTSIANTDLNIMGMPAFEDKVRADRLSEIVELMMQFHFIEHSVSVPAILASQ